MQITNINQQKIIDLAVHPVNNNDKMNAFNSLTDAYMRQWTNPSLVQIMACRLVGAKPLSEPMLINCQLGYWKQRSVKF